MCEVVSQVFCVPTRLTWGNYILAEWWGFLPMDYGVQGERGSIRRLSSERRH